MNLFKIEDLKNRIEKRHIFRKKKHEEEKKILIEIFVEYMQGLFKDIVTYRGTKDIENTIIKYNEYVNFINEKQTIKKFVKINII